MTQVLYVQVLFTSGTIVRMHKYLLQDDTTSERASTQRLAPVVCEHSPGSISLFDHLLLVANVAGSGESSQLRGCRLALNRATEVDEPSVLGGKERPACVHTQGRARLGHCGG